jgi:hypothetical protein
MACVPMASLLLPCGHTTVNDPARSLLYDIVSPLALQRFWIALNKVGHTVSCRGCGISNNMYGWAGSHFPCGSNPDTMFRWSGMDEGHSWCSLDVWKIHRGKGAGDRQEATGRNVITQTPKAQDPFIIPFPHEEEIALDIVGQTFDTEQA